MAFTCSLVVKDRIAKITLTGELDAYWRVMEPVFHWTPAQLQRDGHRFLRDEVFPRRMAMLGIAASSLAVTPRSLRKGSGLSLAPIVHVAILFAGLFACLRPIEIALTESAPSLPLHHSWQLFWACGLLSSVLDNAPTYSAFAALARGMR